MQVLLQCTRLVLALAFILVSSSVQGFPVQGATYQSGGCNPDSNSVNCIEDKGIVSDILPEESSGMSALRTDTASLKNYKKLNKVFPLSEDIAGSDSEAEFGSGFLNEIEQEYQPVEENGPSYNQDLGQDGSEEDFTI